MGRSTGGAGSRRGQRYRTTLETSCTIPRRTKGLDCRESLPASLRPGNAFLPAYPLGFAKSESSVDPIQDAWRNPPAARGRAPLATLAEDVESMARTRTIGLMLLAAWLAG